MSRVFRAHRTSRAIRWRMHPTRGRRLIVAVVTMVLAAPLALAAATSDAAPDPEPEQAAPPTAGEPDDAEARGTGPQLPLGGRRLFPRYRLIAYYGTAGTGSLGVLGERPPAATTRRLREVAERYRGGRPEIQITYELISTVADRSPLVARSTDHPMIVADATVAAAVGTGDCYPVRKGTGWVPCPGEGTLGRTDGSSTP